MSDRADTLTVRRPSRRDDTITGGSPLVKCLGSGATGVDTTFGSSQSGVGVGVQHRF